MRTFAGTRLSGLCSSGSLRTATHWLKQVRLELIGILVRGPGLPERAREQLTVEVAGKV